MENYKKYHIEEDFENRKLVIRLLDKDWDRLRRLIESGEITILHLQTYGKKISNKLKKSGYQEFHINPIN